MEEVKLVNVLFGAGENHVAETSTLKKGYARVISDSDIDDEGVLFSRGAFVASSFASAHSVYTAANGTVYAVSADTLVKAVAPGVWAPVGSAGGVVTDLTAPRMWWTELDDKVYYSNGVDTGVIVAGVARPWGVPNTLVRKSDALSWVSVVDSFGEESGAVLADPTGALNERVYKPTDTVGTDEFKDARGTALYRLGGDQNGRVCEVRGLVPFPASSMIGTWEGRAWGVVGNRIVYSRALHYGLHDPAYDYVEMPGGITALGAVAGGIFVSTAEVVYFLKGFDPDKWQMEAVSDAPAFYGSQVYVPLQHIDPEVLKVAPSDGTAFVWLSKHGLCFGMDDGSVRAPGAKTLRLPKPTSVRSSLLVRDGLVQVVCATS